MKIRRTEDVAWRRIDHETVVVHLTRHFLADLSAEGLVESDAPLPASQAPPPSENDREPPRIEWREEVRRFAGGCAFIPAGSEQCFQDPSTS